MPEFKYKFQMYKHLQANTQKIYAEARQAAEDPGITGDLMGKIGLTGHLRLSRTHEEAVGSAGAGLKKVILSPPWLKKREEIVKDVYGDDYDVCPVNTCEGGLWVTYDTLFSLTPDGTRRDVPLEVHRSFGETHAPPGRLWKALPPKYKEFISERGSTAGEFGFSGKRLENLDVVVVPMKGGKYPKHGSSTGRYPC